MGTSRLWTTDDQPQPWEAAQGRAASAGQKPAPHPVLTVVHAPHLVYTDEDRLAVYTGGVHAETRGAAT